MHSKPLSLVTVPSPFLDESPASWLMRLCQLHGIWPNKLLRTFKINVTRDLDRQLQLEHLEALARASTTKQEKLNCLASKFQHITDPSLSRTFLLCALPRKEFYKFCPECLVTDEVPYWRFTWRMLYYDFCPIHCCQLQRSCSACGQRIRPIREKNPIFESSDSFFCFCHCCGFDLRSSVSKTVEASEDFRQALELQRVITAAVLCGYYVVHGVEGRLPLSTLSRTLLIGGFRHDGTQTCDSPIRPIFQEFLRGTLPISPNNWKLSSNILMRRALRLRLTRLTVGDGNDSR